MNVIAFRARRRTSRAALTRSEKVAAIFRHPALYELGALLPGRQPVGRPADYPGFLMLGYGVLARLLRSGIAVETELAAPGMWQIVRDTASGMKDILPAELVPDLPARPPSWDAFRYARNRHLTDPDVLTELRAALTELAVDQARSMGLLLPDGPGSWCHPHRSRVVYGDGTIVRPLYRPRPDGEEGSAPHRQDPDAAEHHRHDGAITGQNFVSLYARGEMPYQRVVLAVGRVETPGKEADAAVSLLQDLHPVCGSGMQVVVYDGALRGRHIDTLMTGCGVLVVNKVHSSSATAKRRGKTRNPRWHTLGTWQHDTNDGPCSHNLAAVDGAVSEVALDEAGAPVIVTRLDRKQVKRRRRADGTFHFNVAYQVPCPLGGFLAWVTPHGSAGDGDHKHADATRVIAEGEDDFTRLYGVRNDAESANSQFKRTLLVDRAMSLGARRQLLDMLCFALLNNAITQAHQDAARAAGRRRAA